MTGCFYTSVHKNFCFMRKINVADSRYWRFAFSRIFIVGSYIFKESSLWLHWGCVVWALRRPLFLNGRHSIASNYQVLRHVPLLLTFIGNPIHVVQHIGTWILYIAQLHQIECLLSPVFWILYLRVENPRVCIKIDWLSRTSIICRIRINTFVRTFISWNHCMCIWGYMQFISIIWHSVVWIVCEWVRYFLFFSNWWNTVSYRHLQHYVFTRTPYVVPVSCVLSSEAKAFWIANIAMIFAKFRIAHICPIHILKTLISFDLTIINCAFLF